MKDEDIIKALECLVGDSISCQSCAYDPSEYPRCKENCAKDAIALINRQKAEIERLQTEKDNLIRTYKECALEVVKEFADRLKEEAIPAEIGKYTYDIVTTKCIDNLVKEMVGDME